MLAMTRRVLLHPFDFYEELQSRGAARLSHALWIVAATIVARFLSLYSVSYIFQAREAFEISLIVEVVVIVIPWATWAVANWGVSTIMDGEGKFVEVAVGSAYAFVPYTIFAFPIALLSNILTEDDKFLYGVIIGFVYVWAAFLLLMQVKILHDFEWSKMFFVTLLSVFGMLVIWFILLLLYGLIDQGLSFAVNLYKEMNLRI
ncbi:YIP1 family protein [Paenibacillus chungangensis]|uniref:YIP1 family protein n=1 Tax=Paenibacillus chungangensis TaxID=696535 RepID=A0ABW3HWZ3_9BACL